LQVVILLTVLLLRPN